MHRSSAVGLFVFLLVVGSGCALLGEDAEESAIEVVESAYDAYNSGDTEQWVQIRVRGSEFESDDFRDVVIDDMRKEADEQIAAGAVYDDIVCEAHGSGEWPVADAGSVSGYYVTCDTTLKLPEGDTPETFEWVVEDSEVVAVRSNG